MERKFLLVHVLSITFAPIPAIPFHRISLPVRFAFERRRNATASTHNTFLPSAECIFLALRMEKAVDFPLLAASSSFSLFCISQFHPLVVARRRGAAVHMRKPFAPRSALDSALAALHSAAAEFDTVIAYFALQSADREDAQRLCDANSLLGSAVSWLTSRVAS